MANPCPCGCGRRVGWTKTGPAKAYPSVVMMRAELEPYYDWVLSNSPPPDAPGAGEWTAYQAEMRKFCGMALPQMQRWFEEHLHGQARPGSTPDLLALAKGLEAARSDAMAVIQEVHAIQQQGWGVIAPLKVKRTLPY